MATETIRDISDEQLVHRVLKAERDLLSAKFKHANNSLENTTELGTLRKQIARLKTEARAREVKNGLAKGTLMLQHKKSFEGGAAGASSEGKAKGGFLSSFVDKLTGKE